MYEIEPGHGMVAYDGCNTQAVGELTNSTIAWTTQSPLHRLVSRYTVDEGLVASYIGGPTSLSLPCDHRDLKFLRVVCVLARPMGPVSSTSGLNRGIPNDLTLNGTAQINEICVYL